MKNIVPAYEEGERKRADLGLNRYESKPLKKKNVHLIGNITIEKWIRNEKIKEKVTDRKRNIKEKIKKINFIIKITQ